MSAKPKIALYWCASCGGCDETVVDLEEAVLDVVAAVDIVFWPCAMDFKYSDVEALADKELAVSFINGAIRSAEQEHCAKLLRRKSAAVVAFGSCACMGGIPALANLTSLGAIRKSSYLSSPTVENPDATLPQETSTVDGCSLSLPELYSTVLTLEKVIDVDYYLPGCPPTPALLARAVNALLTGTLPPKGSVLLPDKALCAECNRNDTKPETLAIKKLHRIHEVAADPATCFLAQGVLCMGPATRGGCEYPCVKGNMPCTGCYGPLADGDQGARMIATLGGVIDAGPREFPDAVRQFADPAGTLYRYSLSFSLLGSRPEGK
jgi:F420-non-reducing hydrogenase small subunit